MKKSTLSDLYDTIIELKNIEIQLRKHCDDPDKVRSLAKQMSKLL